MRHSYHCSCCHVEKWRTPIDGAWHSNGYAAKLYVDDNGVRFTGLICPSCRVEKRKSVYVLAKPEAQRNKEYRRTLRGFILQSYENMKARCDGRIKRTVHIYGGMTYPSRADYYAWCLKSRKLNRLHKKYVASGFRRGCAPSVDRIDGTKGYVFSNMQWLTNSQNVSKGNKRRYV